MLTLLCSGYVPDEPIPFKRDKPFFESITGGFTLHPDTFEKIADYTTLWMVRACKCHAHIWTHTHAHTTMHTHTHP